MVVGSVRRAVAFAPSHVTGVFSPSVESRDPRGRGSIGAGIVLDVGVRAIGRFDPEARRGLRLTSDLGRRLEISEEAAIHLLGDRRGRLDIHLLHTLPVGQGFGSSAAGAMATALVAARLLDRPRAVAIQAAHLADFFGRGGLGGVAAILGGGLEIRVRPGIPPFGRIEHHRISDSVLVGTVGRTLPSPSILSQPRVLERIRRSAGEVGRLSSRPTLDEFFRQSERFTDRVRLASPRLRAVIRSLRRRDAWAAQAMFGESFIALPRTRSARRAIVQWLLERDLAAIEIRPARRGAFAVPGSVELPA